MARKDVTVALGKPKAVKCEHEWALLNDHETHPEYRCEKCGHTRRRPKE